MNTDQTQSARASFGLGNRRRNTRKPIISRVLCGIPLWTFRGFITLLNFLAEAAALLVRVFGPPLARFTVMVGGFVAAMVAVVYYGAKLTHSGLRSVSAITDSAYETVGEARTSIASFLPRFVQEGDAPRASLVSVAPVAPRAQSIAPPTPIVDEIAPTAPVGFLESLEEKAGEVIGLLPLPLPRRSLMGYGYPAPPDLPPITGAVLEKAGGDRIQDLISDVLDGMHQVEASGQLELIGDNGLAFGPLQVRHEPCEDLQKFFGVTVIPESCNGDWLLSEYVVRLYTGFWAREVEKKTGEPVRGEDILRIWNGGPDMGPASKTDVYVAKALRHDPSIAKLVASKQ